MKKIVAILDPSSSKTRLARSIGALEEAAKTGRIGDGKISVESLEQVLRIRTGERDAAALT